MPNQNIHFYIYHYSLNAVLYTMGRNMVQALAQFRKNKSEPKHFSCGFGSTIFKHGPKHVFFFFKLK